MQVIMHSQESVGDHHVGGTYPDLKGVAGLEDYDARGIAMHLERPDDVLRLPCLHEQTLAPWFQYVTCDLGLVLPQIIYDNTPGSQLNGPYRSRPCVVFKLTDWAVRQRPELATQARLVVQLDNKNDFLRLCTAESIVTPRTQHVDRPTETVEWKGDCWLKPAEGASGQGSHRCRTKEVFAQTRPLMTVPFQVQQHVSGTICSAQLWIAPEGPYVLTTTDQVMGGAHKSEHQGNRFPSLFDAALRRVALRLGGLIYMRGFRGYCGFDFVVASAHGGECVYVLEMNPRLTGAHYPAALASLLGIQEFMHININSIKQTLRSASTLLAHLRARDLLWTRDRKNGIVPWCVSTLGSGKVMVLVPGNRDEQNHLLERLGVAVQ